MTVVAGPVFALALVVGAAGVLKLGRPESAVVALRTAGLPHPVVGVRLLGLAEISLAAAVLAFGSALTTVALALAYAGFAGFAALLMVRSDRAASCGCFGVASAAPTTALHVGVNIGAALVAIVAVAWPPGALGDVMVDQPLAGVPFLVLTGALAWMVIAVLTVVPDLLDANAAVHADRTPVDDHDDHDHHPGADVAVPLGATRR
jgi:hypothetical protein